MNGGQNIFRFQPDRKVINMTQREKLVQAVMDASKLPVENVRLLTSFIRCYVSWCIEEGRTNDLQGQSDSDAGEEA